MYNSIEISKIFKNLDNSNNTYNFIKENKRNQYEYQITKLSTLLFETIKKNKKVIRIDELLLKYNLKLSFSNKNAKNPSDIKVKYKVLNTYFKQSFHECTMQDFIAKFIHTKYDAQILHNKLISCTNS